MPKIQELEFDDLNLLLKASSKQQVIDVCCQGFISRDSVPISDHSLQHVTDALGVDQKEATKVLIALSTFIKNCLFNGYSNAEDIMPLFPEKFHKNLAELITKIIVERYPSWKSTSASSIVSMPRLVEFDWRVDLKMASGKISRMSEPTCILHLKIEDLNASQDKKLTTLNVELSQEKLDTMLSGLSRIRDQLSTVAKK